MQYDWLSWYYEMYDLYVIQDKTLPFVVEHFKRKGFTPRYVKSINSIQLKDTLLTSTSVHEHFKSNSG